MTDYYGDIVSEIRAIMKAIEPVAKEQARLLAIYKEKLFELEVRRFLSERNISPDKMLAKIRLYEGLSGIKRLTKENTIVDGSQVDFSSARPLLERMCKNLGLSLRKRHLRQEPTSAQDFSIFMGLCRNDKKVR